MNVFARATIFGFVGIVAVAAWAGSAFLRSPYATEVNVVRDQPVPFSHDHHVSGLGIDCRFCHTSVEDTPFAGIPPTETCMGCHSIIWRDSPLLAPVRDSFRTGKPLAWTRVHDMPDFVYFNHSIHIAKGIACESCHGRVDRMPLMRKVETMHMEWCLDCHRHPERAVRPLSERFAFGREALPGPGIAPSRAFESKSPVGGASETSINDRRQQKTSPPSSSDGLQLVKQYGIKTKQLSDCIICHR
jgi:hypothetical protein